MLSTLPSLPAVSTTPAPSPQAAAAPAEQGAEPHAFARELQQAQRQDERGDTVKDAAHQPDSPKAAGKPRQAASDAAEGPTKTSPAAQAIKSTSPKAGRPELTSDDPRIDDDTASGDTDAAAAETGPQDLAALLAHLSTHLRGHSAAAEPTPARAAADAGQATADKALATRGGKPAADSPAASPIAALAGKPATSVPAAREPGPVLKDAAAVTQALDSAPVRSASTEGTAKPSAALADAPSFSAILSQASAAASPATGTAPGSSPAAPAQAHLSAPPGTADFAPQLGAQISTFVRDGVQHAQLQLNPADMGPVTVQIQIDGQGAQVHLLADQAQTRQALEQAMPDLAGSLREAGLTLTGGGVFQQPRQTGGETAGQDKAGPRSRGGVAAVDARSAPAELVADARSSGALRRRGVVDLVA